MARIIKRGTKPREVFRGTCNKCGAVVEEDKDALKVVHDRDGSLAEISCPQCGSKMWTYPYPQRQR